MHELVIELNTLHNRDENVFVLSDQRPVYKLIERSDGSMKIACDVNTRCPFTVVFSMTVDDKADKIGVDMRSTS